MNEDAEILREIQVICSHYKAATRRLLSYSAMSIVRALLSPSHSPQRAALGFPPQSSAGTVAAAAFDKIPKTLTIYELELSNSGHSFY